jgi:hypothetical protein
MEEIADKENTLSNNKQAGNFEEKLKQNYDALGKVRITFRTEVAIPNSSKIELFMNGHQKLWELKLKMADFTKLNIFFYINQSFMPALDSRIGDLAQCYGRYD